MPDALPLWDFPAPFVLPVTVVANDIDGFGHVNNTVYFRWLTECAWAHSAAVGLPEAACVALRRGMAVRKVDVEILAAAYLDEALLVGNWLTAKTRLRATRTFQILNPASGVTLLRGCVDYVCVNLDSGRPVRMPPEFEAGYRATARLGDHDAPVG